jgi:hypothetical protein
MNFWTLQLACAMNLRMLQLGYLLDRKFEMHAAAGMCHEFLDAAACVDHQHSRLLMCTWSLKNDVCISNS